MDKKELLLMLDEGVTTEEVPTLTNLGDITELVTNSDIDKKTKNKIMDGIKVMRTQTIFHSNEFSRMMRETIRSEKNEY